MQNHTQQSKNADFSSKRTSFDPLPSQTKIVRLKQNAGNWRRSLTEEGGKRSGLLNLHFLQSTCVGTGSRQEFKTLWMTVGPRVSTDSKEEA